MSGSNKKKTTFRKTKFTLREPVYASIVTFFVGNSFEQFCKIVEKYKHADEKPIDKELRDANGMAVTMRNKNDEVCHVIWLKYFNWNVRPIGILAHEIGHIIFAILNHKNVPIRVENDETFCYLYEFYFVEALKKLNKNK